MLDHFHLGRNYGLAQELFENGRNNTFQYCLIMERMF